ncbi:hypothetical protein T484DRAFT_1903427 [Baffinella frigidus]|nr:hypothetical protein T484DRAFT_1903427 [Cryptophyta sp. CCMP2293]
MARMPEEDGASALWRLLERASYKRPCTGARLYGAAAAIRVDLLHSSHSEKGRSTFPGGAGCTPAHQHSLDIAGGGAAAGVSGSPTDCTVGDFSAPRTTPPRNLKGSPEISLEYDGRGHTWNGGDKRRGSPRQTLQAPANHHDAAVHSRYGRAVFARRDVVPTNTAELLHYTNFPDECAKAFATLTPQT